MASGAPLRHGSHPGHAFEALVPFETFHCSICKGCDNAAESTWYRCCQPACGYTLCPKCFEVDEVLFSSVEVVIRNPQLAYDDLRYVVRTRPRESAHILAPIYAGRLMEVVSTAVSTEDPTQSYFRMRHGGWINTAHVLCVVPAERHMAKLANLHFRGQYVSRGGATALGRLSSSILIECVKESMTLVDLNSPHGVPMAALTIYPLLNVVSRAPNYAVEDDNEEVTVAELTTEVLRFLYFFLHYTMGHILDALDRKQRIECGVALSLYADLLGGCILAALDLSQRWGVLLPAPFGPLIMCAITVWSKLWMQLPPTDETSDYSSLRLRQPAVIIVHVALSSENARLRQFFSWMMENTSRLLMRGVEGERAWGFPYLREIRAHLIHSKSEVLAKAFAEMAYNVMVQESPEKRSRIFDTDPLEVIVRLAKSAELAESQIAALRLVGVMASDCHESVGVLAAVVLGPIMAMCDHAAQSPAVVIAALHCFAQLSGHSVEPTAPLWDGVCSKSAHTRPAAYQHLFSYTLHNGRSVALCAHCASQHPPEEAVVKDEGASVAYFACQCPCCSRGGGACGEPTINVAPAITTTAGGAAVPAGQDLCNNEVVAAFRRGNMSAWLLRCLDQYASNAAVLNAVGRFILHCPNVSEEVVARLVWLLVGLPNVAQFHEAAMAIAARTDLPCVSQKLRMLPDSALTLYALDPYHRHLTATLKMEPSLSNTPVGPSSRPSEGGLSPSPAPSSMYRSSGSMQYRSSSTNNTNPNRASSSSYQPPPAGLMERVFSGNYALEC